MKKPALVVMAAGMGSRYGGLKQIDPVDKEGDIIIDFSIYDALQAGFEKIVFIIKKENEADFRAAIGDRMSKHAGHRSCDHELYRCDRRTICSYQCRRLLWTSCISDGL